MPAVRSLVSKYYIVLIYSIALNGEIISPCFYCVKKGLVCVIIIEPSSCQPSSCFKCTKLNTCVLCDVRSVFFNKCIFFICIASL